MPSLALWATRISTQLTTVDTKNHLGEHGRLMILASAFLIFDNLELKMKKMIVIAAMGMALSTNVAHADLSIDAFKQLSAGDKAQQANVEMYVGGVVKGYLNVNGYLQSRKQPLLFCYSGDINTGKALSLASEAVNEHLSTHPSDGKQEIVELLLMMKLKSLYPC